MLLDGLRAEKTAPARMSAVIKAIAAAEQVELALEMLDRWTWLYFKDGTDK